MICWTREEIIEPENIFIKHQNANSDSITMVAAKSS